MRNVQVSMQAESTGRSLNIEFKRCLECMEEYQAGFERLDTTVVTGITGGRQCGSEWDMMCTALWRIAD